MKKNSFRVVASIACIAVFTALNAVGCSGEVARNEVGQQARNHGISRVVQTTNDLGQAQLDLFDANGISLGALTYGRSATLLSLKFSWEGDEYDVTVDGPQGQSRTNIMVNGVSVVDTQISSHADRMPLSIKPALDLAASLVIDAGLEDAPTEDVGAGAFDDAQEKTPTALQCWYCTTSYFCFITKLSRAKVYGHWAPEPICVEEVWGCGCS
jgi:hypothetical protein